MGALEVAQKRASGHLASISHHAPSSVTFCVTNSFMYQNIIKAQGSEFQKQISSKRTEERKRFLSLCCFLLSRFPGGLISCRFLRSVKCELNESEEKRGEVESANCAEIEIAFPCLMMRLNQKPRDELQLVRNFLIQHIFCRKLQLLQSSKCSVGLSILMMIPESLAWAVVWCLTVFP